MHRQLRGLAKIFVALFLGLIPWVSYWSLARPDLTRHPGNPRPMARHALEARGGIYARGGEPLVVAAPGPDGPGRRHTVPPGLAHVVGYLDPRLGKSGLEAALDGALSGTGRSLWQRLTWGSARRGLDVVTTLDMAVQRAAEAALGDRPGAVVALVPRSGAVLALVSRPGFSLDRLADDWEHLRQDERAPLWPRATRGLYPPGSAFKVVVLATAFASGTLDGDQLLADAGELVVDGYRLSNPGGAAHGLLDPETALARSSNVAFAQLGLQLGSGRLLATMRSLGFGGDLGLEVMAGRSPLPRLENRAALAQASIGQGPVLATPLQMAVVAAAIANDGLAMRPHLVSHLQDDRGRVLQPTRPQPAGPPALPPGAARRLTEGMVAAVERGTGRQAALPGVAVAGKTGTAQNPHGAPHAWFIGFAPARNPQVAVAVVVENGGSGGQVAAPIAARVMAAALAGSTR